MTPHMFIVLKMNEVVYLIENSLWRQSYVRYVTRCLHSEVYKIDHCFLMTLGGNMEETISLEELLTIVWKRITLIITCFFIGIGVSAIVTFFLITPKYQSTVQMIGQTPTNENANSQLSDLNANILMINTYKDVIKSNTVLSAAQEELQKQHLAFKMDELASMISIEQSQNSQMFEIKVVTDSPKKAMNVANTVANVFKDQLVHFVQSDKVTILSPAIQDDHPISPNKKLNLLIGAFLGFLIGLGITFVLELFNNTVKDSSFVTEVVDLPILGTITEMSPKELKESKNIDFRQLRASRGMEREVENESQRSPYLNTRNPLITRGRNFDEQK